VKEKKKKNKGKREERRCRKNKKEIEKKEGVNEEQRFVKQMKFDNMDEVST
jgi:hypothetical protein